MAGKSNRGKNRKGSQQSAVNSAEQSVSSEDPSNFISSAAEANGDMSLSESVDTNSEVKEQENAPQEPLEKQGGVNDAQIFAPLVGDRQ